MYYFQVIIEPDEIEKISFIQIADPAEMAKRSVRNTPVAQDSEPSTSTQPQQPPPEENKKESPTSFTNKRVNINDRNQKTSKPIAIRQNNNNSSGNGTSSSVPHSMKLDAYQQQQGKRYNNNNNKKRNYRNFDLMQPDDFSDQGDFDFESSNAMFDKKSIFQEIDEKNSRGEKPDLVLVSHKKHYKPEEKYRHDENVIDSMLMQFRNVQLEFKPKQEYSTDEPYIIVPSIPQSLRNRIQNLAADHGHSMERQNDFLARGACELALTILGGSRRFSPKNAHQWPRVTIICDEPYNFKQSEIGLSCARQLASHGVSVMVYVKTSTSFSDKPSKELELFTASGNDFTGNVNELLPCDLVIMAVTSMNQSSQIIRYIQGNRAPVMAIDPPVTGINPGEINIRYAVLPILPIDDIHNTCDKLHLVNLCISEKFFKDAGVKYSPVFGSKFMIPLHLKT